MLPIFAQELHQTADEMGKWLGPLLATVGAIAASLFAWLSSRDKLRFDAEKGQMQADIARLKDETKDCHEERAADRVRYERDMASLREWIGGVDRRKGRDPNYRGPERRSPEGDGS